MVIKTKTYIYHTVGTIPKSTRYDYNLTIMKSQVSQTGHSHGESTCMTAPLRYEGRFGPIKIA
jgi:hypothetical protein